MGMASDQPEFDFGTDPASVETLASSEHGGFAEALAEDELTSWRHGETLRQVPAKAASAGSEVELRSWREVPQATFLQWPEATQLAYCAARDEDAALSATARGEDPQFYIERARSYREQVRD